MVAGGDGRLRAVAGGDGQLRVVTGGDGRLRVDASGNKIIMLRKAVKGCERL